MEYNKNDYPDSFKNLEPKVRDKAIEIVNRIIEEGEEKSKAIPIALAKAKEWANDSGVDYGEEKQHVIPHKKGWAIKKSGAEQVSFTFDSKEEAMDKARELSKNQKAMIVVHKKDGTIEKEMGPFA